MPGFVTALLLLVAALNCRIKVSAATDHGSSNRSHAVVTFEPRDFSDADGGSEGEDGDWEEHYEWTYTQLNDDGESGESKLRNPSHHHRYVGGLIRTAHGAKTSRNKLTGPISSKRKSNKFLTFNQRMISKRSQQRKKSSHVWRKSTGVLKTPKSKVKSIQTNVIRVVGGHFNGPGMHLRKKSSRTFSSGDKGGGAVYVKRSYGGASSSGIKKNQSRGKPQNVWSNDARKKSSLTKTSHVNFGSKNQLTSGNKFVIIRYTNRNSLTRGTFIRKGNKRVRTHRRGASHGASRSSNAVKFPGSRSNGRVHSSPGSRNTRGNKMGLLRVKLTGVKASRRGGAAKRYENKIGNTSGSQASQATKRNSASRHARGSAKSWNMSVRTLKKTHKSVFKRNRTGSPKVTVPHKTKRGGGKSSSTMINKMLHQRGNLRSKITSGIIRNAKKASRGKTSQSRNGWLLGSNTIRTVQSTNYKIDPSKSRLKMVPQRTVDQSSSATDAFLGTKQLKTAQRATRGTSKIYSRYGSRFHSRAHRTNKGGKSRDKSRSRLTGRKSSSGVVADLGGKRRRGYLAYNESSWSDAGDPLVDKRYEYPLNRYLLGSRRSRKKGRAIVRVRRILRRRRKRRGRHKIETLPGAEAKVRHSSRGKLDDDTEIAPMKTKTEGSSGIIRESPQKQEFSARLDDVKPPAAPPIAKRSQMEASQLRKTTTPTVPLLKPQTTRKPEVISTERISVSTKRPKAPVTYVPPNEKAFVRQQENPRVEEMPSSKVLSPVRKDGRTHSPYIPKTPVIARKTSTSNMVSENDALRRRHRRRNLAHPRPRCRSTRAVERGRAGKFAGSGLMWFPAASCVSPGLDWNSSHSTACLHQQIAFVHRYKVLAPALELVNKNYVAGFCGSYVPWSHFAPHHVADLLYDGGIVSGLSMHRFGFVNPGGYMFELLPHTGRLILVGVPFHRRGLSLCNLETTTLDLLFTGTGQRDGSLGKDRFMQICDRLQDHVRSNPNGIYWGFPTVSVRTTRVAVQVPEASTRAITPVVPIATESAEVFAQKVFTEPLALYPDAPVDYHVVHTDFLEPVVFLANHVDHDVDEGVVLPPLTEGIAKPAVTRDYEVPVVEGIAETMTDTNVNDGAPTVNEIKDSVKYINPIIEDVHPDIAISDITADAFSANVPAENVDDDVNEKNYIGYDAGLDLDDPNSRYYQEFADPVVYVTEQMLSYPSPAT